MDKIIFSKPFKADPGATQWGVTYLGLDLEAELITVRLRELDGEGKARVTGRVHNVRIKGPQALAVMAALNRADLRQQTLYQRVLGYLVDQGHIETGTVEAARED